MSETPRSNEKSRNLLRNALALPQQGRVFDLDPGRWPGMPSHSVHPSFEVITYRTPRGERNQRDLTFVNENQVGFGFITELVMGTTHTGAHIDALCHVTRGDASMWHGEYSADEYLGDFGALTQDAADLPPIIGRGVLLDVAAAHGVRSLPVSHAIGVEDLETAHRVQGTGEIGEGDIVLVRTGQMADWPNEAEMRKFQGSGVSLDGAHWIADHRPLVAGGDCATFEVQPSGILGDPQPVHVFLLAERGIPILEWVYLEELSAAQCYEFLFVCLPLRIRGATGSMIRPVAVT